MAGVYTNDNNTKHKVFEVEYWEMTPEYWESYDYDSEVRDTRNDYRRNGKKDRDTVKWQNRKVYFQSDLDETASDVEKVVEYQVKQTWIYLREMYAWRQKRACIKGSTSARLMRLLLI